MGINLGAPCLRQFIVPGELLMTRPAERERDRVLTRTQDLTPSSPLLLSNR